MQWLLLLLLKMVTRDQLTVSSNTDLLPKEGDTILQGRRMLYPSPVAGRGSRLHAHQVQNVRAQLACAALVSRRWDAEARHVPSTVSTGAPPPMGPGSGQLFLVVRSLLMPNGGDLGPAVLQIREHRPKDPRVHDTWGPPGGKTDRTDHSPLHAALREFNEEVGVPIDMLRLANIAGRFYYARLRGSPNANEAWMLFVDSDANTVENALFGEDRSGWSLYKRLNTPCSNEVGGYALIPIDALLNVDRNGNFRIGKHVAKLRTPGRTLEQAKAIRELLNGTLVSAMTT